jgi:cytochrome c oxidase subunit II
VVRAGGWHWVRAAQVGLISVAVLVLAGCGKQSSLEPQSHPARRISHLWWIMMTGAWIGFAVVAGLLALGWVHRRKAGLWGRGERMATGVVIGMGIALPIVLLSVLFVYSDLFVLKSTAAPKPGSTSMTIDVVGHQWFWEVRYEGTTAVTANELHIPTRTRVRVVGMTADVIHSFWVPQLNRKIDLIPGRRNEVLLEADKPGVYRGQCSEFCGIQHANMATYVFADPPERFKAWLRRMGQPARQPATAQERRGREIFLSNACSGCHTIRGTSAHGRIGPDLTHVGSRTTLGALTIPNNPGYMSSWIENPQQLKRGVKMPSLHLSASQIQSVVAYLESLE